MTDHAGMRSGAFAYALGHVRICTRTHMHMHSDAYAYALGRIYICTRTRMRMRVGWQSILKWQYTWKLT